jgi:hypothetical protein
LVVAWAANKDVELFPWQDNDPFCRSLDQGDLAVQTVLDRYAPGCALPAGFPSLDLGESQGQPLGLGLFYRGAKLGIAFSPAL